MRTRRSWRNQNTVWKMLSKGNWNQVTSGQSKPEPKPAPPQHTEEEVRRMWWISERSRNAIIQNMKLRALKKALIKGSK